MMNEEAEKFNAVVEARVSIRGDEVMHTISVDMDDAHENNHLVPHLKKMFIEVLHLSGGSDAYDLYVVDGTSQLFIPDEEQVVKLYTYFLNKSFLMIPRM